MADPVLQARYRVQAIFHGVSGLPEDRFVNSWGFMNLDLNNTPLGAAEMFGRVLDAFYFTAAVNGSTIAGFMSKHLVSANTEYRVYDLGNPPPRDPIIVTPQVALPPFSAADPLPEEVAVVLSLQGQNIGWDAQAVGSITPVPRKTRRGRLFLGPWGIAVMQSGTQGARVLPLLRDTIVDRANNIINSTENMSWDIISPTRLLSTKVIGGYVDNAFDTQRRRGKKETERTAFGTYVAS